MTSTYSVFLGLDVGKGEHHAVGLDPAGKRLHDDPLPNSEPKLIALFDKLAAHGLLLVAVDQPATIGALPVAVARAHGHQVAYLPGLAMRRIVDLYPGGAKTDARDAYVIADAARTLPHTLRQVGTDEALAELDVLVGFDDDLAAETTRISNRIRGCSPASTPRWNACSAPRPPTRRGWNCSSTAADRQGWPGPGGASSPRSPPGTLPSWAPSWPPTSAPRWPSRPGPFPARPPRRWRCPAWSRA
ncbi:hypothetical protein JOF53_006481 [Crossiella equi]|uniref:Transposase IS110-like N-terminal domain-containing protein n=1 Tax=Crossiella equi TaxID=130796 RepID=A0ABS5AN48_9PSEU|nr:hypothetical protein [Crossiella equi]